MKVDDGDIESIRKWKKDFLLICLFYTTFNRVFSWIRIILSDRNILICPKLDFCTVCEK